MNYKVIWRKRLLAALDTLVFLAVERGGDAESVKLAAREVGRQLAQDPLGVGESRGGEERVLIVHPLTVMYEVFEKQRVVLLYKLTRYPRLSF
jgi:hypothetical protein